MEHPGNEPLPLNKKVVLYVVAAFTAIYLLGALRGCNAISSLPQGDQPPGNSQEASENSITPNPNTKDLRLVWG